MGGGGEVVIAACWGGERWKEFLRIPVRSKLAMFANFKVLMPPKRVSLPLGRTEEGLGGE